ncbi:MAG: ROK family protein [Pseudobutyrivibrio sp.]|nr:ROK family protein [Pseudobutyrivibrio sp.]
MTVIALDIGGTCIKYGLVDQEGKEIASGLVATETSNQGFLNQVFSIIDEMRQGRDDILGIGISLPGFVNPATGENTDFTVWPCFIAFNLKEEVEKHTGLPVCVENDSNCAAIAEGKVGAAKGCDNYLMVTVGTGLGGAIVTGGKLMRGAHFKAGELGFLMLEKGRFPGATSDLVRRVADYVKECKEGAGDKTQYSDETLVDGRFIFSHMSDSRVRDIYLSWLEELAITLGNVVSILDVDMLLIGGGISEEPVFINDLTDKIYDLFPLKEYTKIKACSLGNQAGKIGAAILLKDKERM